MLEKVVSVNTIPPSSTTMLALIERCNMLKDIYSWRIAAVTSKQLWKTTTNWLTERHQRTPMSGADRIHTALHAFGTTRIF